MEMRCEAQSIFVHWKGIVYSLYLLPGLLGEIIKRN